MQKFKVPAVPPTKSKSVRFPITMLDQIDAEIQGTDCTFSAFVVEAVRVALANLAEERGSKSNE